MAGREMVLKKLRKSRLMQVQPSGWAGLGLGGTLYAWEDGYQPGPNQAEPGLCEYDGGHI